MKKKTILLIIAVAILSLVACQVEREVDFSSGEAREDLSDYFGHERYIPDIETFMQIGYVAVPSITPDGKTVFYISSSTGDRQLYRLSTNGWPYQLTFFDEGLDWYVLSHEGFLAIVGADVGGSENAQMFLVDTRTGRTKQLTDEPTARFEGVRWSPDDKVIYYASNEENGKDFKLYKSNLITGEKEKLLDLEGLNFWGDVSPNGKKLIYGHLLSNVNTNLYLFDLDSGDTTLLTPHEGDVDFKDAYFSADGTKLYTACDDNEQGFYLRATIDLDSGILKFIEGEKNWNVDSLNISRDRRYMAWITNEDGYARLNLADMKTGKSLPVPNLDGIVDNPFFSENGQLVFSFNSSKQTTDIWKWNWDTGELIQMTFSSYAGIDPKPFTDPQLIKYKSFDGLEIPAFLYLPAAYKGGPIPFILDMHGGPESQYRPYFSRHFQYLMLHGFGLLAPNVRGSDGYGKDYMAMDNYKNRLNSVKDMKAGADWLIAQGYTKQGMIGVKGGSYGGYMAMAAITEYPGFFSAALDDVGIVNFVSFLKNTADYRRYVREAEYGPLSDSAFLKSISPINKADLIETPLLVVHGVNDPRVPVSEARQIIRAIQSRGGVVDSLIFPDEGHGISKRENRLTYYRKMVEFFEKYLKK